MAEIAGTDGADRLDGTAGGDMIGGGAGDDLLSGGGGEDRLDGGADNDQVSVDGDDFATGGEGVDSLEIRTERWADGIAIDLSAMWSGGTGTVGSGTAAGFELVSLITGSDGNDFVILGSSGIASDAYGPPVWGMGGDDRLTGGDDRDRLFGHEGDDGLFGLGGDDLLVGLDGNDRIEGGAGDDILFGSFGTDALLGGAGSDTYQYFNGTAPSEDEILEEADEAGEDVIEIWPYLAAVVDAAFAGVRDIETAHLVSTTDLAGAEFLLGAEFQATGIGTVIAAADVDASQVSSSLEFVITRPNIRPVTVTGGSGDDHFRFGEYALPAFVDGYTIAGGDGFDTLWLDQAIPSYGGGAVELYGFEAIVIADGGDSLARSTTSLAASAAYYPLRLTNANMDAGTQFLVDARQLDHGRILQLDVTQLTGGRGVKVLAGSAADLLAGSNGNDALFGGAGNDRIDGGASGDLLSGEAGADTLRGGPGNDTYVVDSVADTVIENGRSGTDTVRSSVDFRLPIHFEHLIVTGTAGRTAFGNAGDNRITGNGGANRISGGSGNDTIDAGAGNDLVYGGPGNDSLKGGTGLDRFLFNTALAGSNVDKILDFHVPSDTIDLHRSIFTQAGPNGTLTASAMRIGTAARDASDRIVYDGATGRIFYDPDGTGAAPQTLFATVPAGTPLTNADFVIHG